MQLIISILMFLVLFVYVNYLYVGKKDIEKNKFEGRLFNVIHLISYSFPINIFLKNEEKLNKREEKTKRKIAELDLGYMFNLRSFMALKFFLLFVPLFTILIIMGILKYYKGDSFLIFKHIKYFFIPLILAYVPDLYLIKKQKDFEKFEFDEIVTLQLFMVLLIKSDATIEDILYAFSRMETYHKRTFKKAYRISLRNKSEALNYLENKFNYSIFGNSFKVLDGMYRYSKEDSVRILNANLRAIEKESLKDKTKKELKKFSFSQVSVIIPFLIVVFLGAIPLIQYGVHIMLSALQGM